jgi:hypothetical protein
MWLGETEECSGLTGTLDRISFYRVTAPLSDDGVDFPCGGGYRCSGLWRAPHDIYLAPAVLRVERLVKHEMLHDLIGAPGHPPIFEACNLLDPFFSEATGTPGTIVSSRGRVIGPTPVGRF